MQMKTGNRRRVPDRNREFARSMRSDATKAENVLWQTIRNKQLEGFRFKRQVRIRPEIWTASNCTPSLLPGVFVLSYSTDGALRRQRRGWVYLAPGGRESNFNI